MVQAQIYLSPLRDRGSDILLLARCFLSDYSAKNRSDKRFSDKAEKKLLGYRYPGNVRQLQNLVKLAYIHCEAEVIEDRDIILPDASDNALNVDIPSEGLDLDNGNTCILQGSPKLTNNNASEAARLLGLKPHTFRARLKALEESKNNDHK